MIFTVIGLGYGDEGKGHTVAALTRKYSATANIRFSGGSQAAHRVVADGKGHVFAQIGSGTAVSGTVKTYLTRQMAVDPINLLNEIDVHNFHGLKDILLRLLIDPECPIITTYHKMLNRAREKARIDKISTTGLGVGEVHDDVREGRLVIYAKDLLFPSVLKEKLSTMHTDKINEMLVLGGVSYFNFGGIYSTLVWAGKKLHDNIRADFDERLTGELKNDVVLEGSQGTLLDMNFGIRPYITRCSVSLREAERLLSRYYKYSSARCNIGVTRAYMTRHGLGPFPSEDAELTALLPDAHNKANEWQQKFRCGWLDMKALNYSLRCNSGIHHLAVTNLDRLPEGSFFAFDRHRLPFPNEEAERLSLIAACLDKEVICHAHSENVEEIVFDLDERWH